MVFSRSAEPCRTSSTDPILARKIADIVAQRRSRSRPISCQKLGDGIISASADSAIAAFRANYCSRALANQVSFSVRRIRHRVSDKNPRKRDLIRLGVRTNFVIANTEVCRTFAPWGWAGQCVRLRCRWRGSVMPICADVVGCSNDIVGTQF